MTPEELEAIQRRHIMFRCTEACRDCEEVCDYCDSAWPCDAKQLLDEREELYGTIAALHRQVSFEKQRADHVHQAQQLETRWREAAK